MDFQQHAAVLGFEGAVGRSWRAAGVGVGGKWRAAVPIGIIAYREIARDEVDLLPVVMHEGGSGVYARRESEKARLRAALRLGIQAAGQDFFMDFQLGL